MKYETYAWIGLTGIILSFLAYLLGMNEPIIFSLFMILTSITSLIFRWAFVEISQKTKNTTLLVGSISLIVLNILGGIFYLITLFFLLFGSELVLLDLNKANPYGVVILTAVIILFLILASFLIVTGIGFLGLKKKFKGLATATGVLHIISGSLFLTFILAFLGIFTMLAAFVLELIMLFKADKLIK